MFIDHLHTFSHNGQGTFFLDDYIIELSEDRIRFGVARGGHSGGYWYVPTVTESEGKLSFCGKIQYIDAYSGEKGVKKIVDAIEEILLCILLLPILLLIKVYFGVSWVVRKIFKRAKPQEDSLEERLYRLMEDHLHCRRL